MLAGVTDCRRSQKWGCKGRWALGFKPRPGSHRKKRPRGSEVNGEDHKVLGEKEEETTRLQSSREDHKVLGEKEETTRLKSKWGGDHAALKEGVNHEALKQVDR